MKHRYEPAAELPKTTTSEPQRNSAGCMAVNRAPDMIPSELLKQPIKPRGVPLETDQFEYLGEASAENELIVNKLESMEEKRDAEKQRAKVNKYTAYAARGFGTFNPTLGRGVYWVDLQKALRRQANALKHTLWDLEIRAPIDNRIASDISLARWGSEDGRNGRKDAIALGDCPPLDSQAFGQFRLIGDKLDDRAKKPTTAHMFVKAARQQSRLYAAAYGEEHLGERLNAIDRLNEIHEECPEYFTVAFIIETWGRMTFQYNACVAEWIHFILGGYDEGVTFGKIKRFALSPDQSNGEAWKFTPIFEFDSEPGFWKSVILPEIKAEGQRQDILTLVAAREKGVVDKRRKWGDRLGGEEEKVKTQDRT